MLYSVTKKNAASCFSYLSIKMLALLLIFMSEFLQGEHILVDMDKDTVKALVNEDVLLKCLITGFTGSELQLENVGILWSSSSSTGKKTIYSVRSGSHVSEIYGAVVYEDGLKYGNASLHLRNVKFTEEGEYECKVYVTPDKAVGISRLEVSARPSVSISAEVIENVVRKENLLTCNVHNFFPRTITVGWINKSSGYATEIEKNVCMASPAGNDDGTFSMTSHLRLQSSTSEDIKSIYECIVTHRTLPDGFNTSTTLTEKLPKDVLRSNRGYIVLYIILILLNLGLILGIAYVLGKRCGKSREKAAPKISSIFIPENIIHKEQTRLSCSITGFQPAYIHIQWFLILRDGRKQKIYDWNDSAEELNTHDTVCIPLLVEEMEEPLVENDTVSIRITPPKRCVDGTYSVTCSLLVFFDINIHHEGKVIVEVSHSALKEPLLKSAKLHVQGVHPTLSSIMKPQHVRHFEPLALTCAAEVFKPRPLAITWYKTDCNGMKHEIIHLDERGNAELSGTTTNGQKYIHHLTEYSHKSNHTFTVTSVLMFAPVISEDDNSTYHCKVHHCATHYETSKAVTLQVKASPKFDKIQIIPEAPFAGETVELSCKIHSFYPQDINIEWLKEDEKLPHVKISELRKDDSGLYYLISTVTFTSKRKDFKRKMKCRVSHESLIKPQEQTLEMSQLIVAPLVSSITTIPEVPCVGMPVTLSFKAEEHFPAEFIVFWTRGNDSSHLGKFSECEKNKQTGLFISLCHKQITPTLEDMGVMYTAEISHLKSGRSLTSVTHTLSLKACSPTVSEIKVCRTRGWLPLQSTIHLEVTASDFAPSDITAAWYQADKLFTGKSVISPPKVKANGLYLSVFKAELDPKTADQESNFVCEVEHKATHSVERKACFLKPKDCYPTVSDISCCPEEPSAGDEVTLSCEVTRLSSPTSTVSWHKEDKEIKEGVRTTEPSCGSDGYKLKTELRFTATQEDQGIEYSVIVMDPKLSFSFEDKFSCILFNPRPLVSEVYCHPKNPSLGEEVTLTCDVTKLSSSKITPCWFKNDTEIKEGISALENLPDLYGYYKVKAELKFIAKVEDDRTKYTLKVQHPDHVSPVVAHTVILLKPYPMLKEIQCSPDEPFDGEEVILSCAVSRLSSPKATVCWLKQGKEIKTGVCTTKALLDTDGYMLRSELKFIAEKKNDGIDYIIKVLDPNLKIPVEETCSLFIFEPDPLALKILCCPEVPSAGEEVRLSCDVTGLSSPQTTVCWFKKDEKKEIKVGVNTTEALRARGGYKLKSELRLIAAQEDDSIDYTIKVLDKKLKTLAEKAFNLKLSNEVMSQIKCEPTNPNAGDIITHSCSSSDVTPDDTQVTSDKDIDPLVNSSVENVETEDKNGSASVLKLQPSEDEKNCEIICSAEVDDKP